MKFLDRLKNYLTKHLFCVVSPEDVIRTTKDGRILLGNEQISQIELHALQEEVRFIQACRVWKIVNETLKYDALERSFSKSTSFDDLKTGKLMLLNLEVMNNTFNLIKNKNKT